MPSNFVPLFRVAIVMIVAKKKILIKSLNTLMVRQRVVVTLQIAGIQKVTCRIPTRGRKPLPPPKLGGKRDIMTEKGMTGRVPKKNLKGQQTEEKRKQGETDRQGLFQKQVK